MAYITKILDQKTMEMHAALMQRLLPMDTVLSDGVNVARYRVVRVRYVQTSGNDFALEGEGLLRILDALPEVPNEEMTPMERVHVDELRDIMALTPEQRDIVADLNNNYPDPEEKQ
jgi:hypothetical protein